MSTILKRIPNGSLIEFDDGSFDSWCVYLTRKDKERYAPKDLEYFTVLNHLGKKYGPRKVYDDFVKIYKRTYKIIDKELLRKITRISEDYGQDKHKINTWLTIIYAGMVAEENKEKAILKKRVKRLGMYQLLVEQYTPDYAANFSKGKNWKELDAIMKRFGF